MQNEIDEKILLAKAEDTVALCEKQYTTRSLGFLTPAEMAVVKKNLHKICGGADVRTEFYGGYSEAERCLFVALPEYAQDDEVSELICVLEISGRDTEGLSHRDFLGSLLGLGLKRGKIGDILRVLDKTIVFVLSDIADYIITNLEKVGRCGVKIRKLQQAEIEIPKRRYEEIRTTVAALRLDCVVAAALKTSRAVAAEAIKSGRVSVNWLETDNISAQIKPEDVFSVRGAGRFRLSAAINETKKGRLGICIEKAI